MGIPPRRPSRRRPRLFNDNNNSNNNNINNSFVVLSRTIALSLIVAVAATILLLPSTVCASASDDDSDLPSLDEPFQGQSFERLNHVPCVTLYHRTGRVGCGTYDRSTSTGRLLHWTTVAATTTGSSSSSSPPPNAMPPYVAVVPQTDFTLDAVNRLKSFASGVTEVLGGSEREKEYGAFRGVLVLNVTSSSSDSSSSSSSTSPAPQSPRGYGTPSASLSVATSYPWNPTGDGLTVDDLYGVPVAYVPDVDLSTYLQSVSNEQSGVIEKEILLKSSSSGGNVEVDEDELYPAIVSEFNYYMGPSDGTTSKECLSWIDTDGVWRPKCLPLGGNSVWAVAGSPLSSVSSSGGDSDGKKPVIVLATGIDSTSMFHDAAPGSNTAASNALAILLAAKLIGSTLSDETINGWGNQIGFGLFQGETYGYLGSRAFIKDAQPYPGFECDEGLTVPAVAKDATSSSEEDGGSDGGENTATMACLNPMRHSLEFAQLGKITGMIAVDQVGVLKSGSNNNNGNNNKKALYVHGGGNAVNNDDGTANFLSNVLLQLSTDDVSVAEADVDNNDNNNNNGGNDDDSYPLPPSPLTSLMKLSEGVVGGAVLTGYDSSYDDDGLYHSHLDSVTTRSIDLSDVASAATILARAAVAAASDDGSMDAETAASNALALLPNGIDPTDEDVVALANCLLVDGNCDSFVKHGTVERANVKHETGVDVGMPVPLGTPPNYYVSVYDSRNGQAFVQIGDRYYGAFTDGGDDEDDKDAPTAYGDKDTDAFLVRPSLLEQALYGTLNDYLGRGAFVTDNGGNDVVEIKSCDGTGDCTSVSYCDQSLAPPVCAGGSCVCGQRAHYHVALDESITAAPNNGTSMFLVVDDDDEGGNEDGSSSSISALYTEPYWSSDVGVRVYRDAGGRAGNWALGAGLFVAAFCSGATMYFKSRLKKEKVL